jgi:hypothetical protein
MTATASLSNFDFLIMNTLSQRLRFDHAWLDAIMGIAITMLLTLCTQYRETLWKRLKQLFSCRSRKYRYQTMISPSLTADHIRGASSNGTRLLAGQGAYHHLIINGVLRHLDALGILEQCSSSELSLLDPSTSSPTNYRKCFKSLTTSFLPKTPVEWDGMRFTFVVKEQSLNHTGTEDSKSDKSDDKDKDKSKSTSSDTAMIKVVTLYIEYNHIKSMRTFLEDCQDAEIDRVAPEKPVNNQRHIYQLIKANLRHAENARKNYYSYKPEAYEFSKSEFHSAKTFDSIFFEQKDILLQTIKDFTERTGAWHPRRQRTHKLVIMMSSAPGHGKTSCLKALAKFTDRDLFTVNPAVCHTDRDLSVVMMSDCVPYRDASVDVFSRDIVPLSQRIVVMEDLDACGCDHLLHREAEEREHERLVKQMKELVKVDSTTMVAPPSKPETTFSGFLNVLDGMAELHDLILVITTNKPDKFDPAFIRPGRIDLMLDLKGMTTRMVRQMMEYYFHPDVMNERTVNVLEDYMKNRETELAPCVVEEVCQLAHNVEEAVERLVGRKRE